MSHLANLSPGISRDTQGIDQCLDRLGELRGMANILREHLERMDQKLHGPKPKSTPQAPEALVKAPSNVDDLEQKLTDLHYLLNTIRDHIVSINNFINAPIN